MKLVKHYVCHNDQNGVFDHLRDQSTYSVMNHVWQAWQAYEKWGGSGGEVYTIRSIIWSNLHGI